MENSPQFITIEKISNGFLVSVPSNKGNQKYHKGTINGLVQLLEKLWDKKYIHIEKEEKIILDISSIKEKIEPKPSNKI